MASLDDVKSKMADQKTLIGSLTTFVQGLQAQIAALGLNPADQAKVDEIFQDAVDDNAAITAAMTTNTPAAPAG